MKSRRWLALALLVSILTVLLAACGEDIAPLNISTTTASTTAATTTGAALTTSPVTTAPAATTVASLPTITPRPVTTDAPTTAPATTEATTDAPTSVPATTVAQTTAPASTTAPVATTRPASAQAIRDSNWEAVYQADDQYYNGRTDGPCELMDGKYGLYGTPGVEQIVYVDMDGDGVEEAALPLESGGTAGNLSVVIYKYSPNKPYITACVSGYKLSVKLDKGQLQVWQPIYSGDEPNCCPSGMSYTNYVLAAGKLKQVARRSEGFDGGRAPIVEYFYGLLNQKKLDEAYKLLAPAYQKANPYAKWAAGYNSTFQVSATATDAKDGKGTVNVVINSTDKGPGAQPINKTFKGSWKVNWDANLEQWTLSSPLIQETTAAKK